MTESRTLFSEAELRDRIVRVALRRLSLDDFEDWFVSHSWNAHQSADQSLLNLIGLVEIYLAEYSSGHRDEQQVRFALGSLLMSGQPAAANVQQPVLMEMSVRSPVHVGDIVRFASNVEVSSIGQLVPANSSVEDEEPQFQLAVP